jgi:hypothetical protein
MAYVRRATVKGHTYYYLVESYRPDVTARARTLAEAQLTPPEKPTLGQRLKRFGRSLWS